MCVIQQLTTQNPNRFLNFLAYAIPSICLKFFWTAFMWDILSSCSCCIWGGSAPSTTQTGCEVLCLLGFLCEWPQCLVFRHRLSSHSEGGLACAPHVQSSDEGIGSAPNLQRLVPGVALLHCKLEASAVRRELRGRSFKAVQLPFDALDSVLYRQ